jgi:hypothetical protein
MLRVLLTVIATLFLVRLVSQFVHAVIVGMRGDLGPARRGAGVRGHRPPGVRETRPLGDDAPAHRPAVNRAQVIDVDYVDVEQERAAAGEGQAKG